MRANSWSACVLAVGLSLGASAKDFSRDLVTAVQKGEAAKVGTLLAQGADPNTIDKKSGQPVLLLALAARTGDSSIAKALIAKGANVNFVPSKGSPALHLAVGNRNMEVIDLLLGAGGDPLLRSKEGDTPLELSKRGGCSNCYLALLKAQYRDAPAIYAVRTGNDTDLKAAIAKGTDVNLRDKSGLTALLYATSLAGASQFVRQLLTAGADSNASTPTGQTIGMDLIIGGLQFRIVGGGTTPLMLAAMNVDSDAIASLVAASANLAAKNDKGETACQMIPGPQSPNDAVMELVENEARRLRGLPPKPSVAPNSSRLAEARGALCK